MEGRHDAVRRRVLFAERALVGVALVVFAGAFGLARLHAPGHRKQQVTPLRPPADLLRVVRRDQLAAGIVAPAQAPPGIGSAPS